MEAPRDATQSQARWRWMLRSDIEAVARIERKAFRFSKHPSFQPYSLQQIARLLREGHVSGCVLCQDGCVVAYSILGHSRDYIAIYRIAVDPDHQRSGLGTRLVQGVKRSVEACKRNKILAAVPDDLVRTQIFFRSMGFKALHPNGSDLYRFIWLNPPSRMETEAFHAIIKKAF
ncbi:Acetyltransferase (GNAT) family protein [Pirellula sp. SH-Sr6A]|uniref:GNAT family N-acetyltransferase n=1 Tax=Pirellula sp. SH-Sr6A TaxID=1632865 RepID=UPI00078E9027|nr:GNAT family N-acetyltransferase [Pirellula sp. SH-Sr6A]AMV33773.1 Acetyltransferase (GNAT) family protein [Pirellula sp. SH-Sr6A]